MTRQQLHRRLQVAEARVGHISRLAWRKAGRSGGSVGRGLLAARVDQLERAMARAMLCLSPDDGVSVLDVSTAGAMEAFMWLSNALGDSDWRGEMSGWDGESEVELVVPVPIGSEILVDGERYRIGFERILRAHGAPTTVEVVVGRPTRGDREP